MHRLRLILRRRVPAPALLLAAVLPVLAAAANGPPGPFGPSSITLAYEVDRSPVPPVTWLDLTVKVRVGVADRVVARVDGRPVAIALDRTSGWAVVTTTGKVLEVEAWGANTATPGFGDVEKAALLGDKRWAWSHGFDDNTGFKGRGIEALRQRGWTASVFLICGIVHPVRDEPWIVDAGDVRRLVREGWGIGNHTWSHQTVKALGGPVAAREDVLRCARLLRSIVRPVRPDNRLVAFSAPVFDQDYKAVIDDLRDRSPEAEILFDESGNDFLQPIDPGQFDPRAAVGRDPAIEGFGSGNPGYDNRQTLLRVHALANGTRHWWYNTLSHGVDGQPDGRGFFAFLDFLHRSYGPGGTDEVWVAPSDRVFSYLLVRDRSRVTRR
jgi:peptidoglycan/xylan/chitin deacetylase (PgdA/CDA1 family)